MEFRGCTGRSGEGSPGAICSGRWSDLHVPATLGEWRPRLPDHAALQTYRAMAPMACAKITVHIIERNATSGPDLPAIQRTRFEITRRSTSIWRNTFAAPTAWTTLNVSRSSLMWDAIGSESGGRHELYEINYSGSQTKSACSVCASAKLRQHGQNDGDGRPPLRVRVRPERLTAPHPYK